MDYAPLIKRVVDEANGQLSVSEIVARVMESSNSVPSFDEFNSALAKVGREPVSAEAYAIALADYVPVHLEHQKRTINSLKRRGWLNAVVAAWPLAILGVMALGQSAYDIATVALGYAILFVLSVIFPESKLSALLSWNIGIRRKPDESLTHFQLKSGLLVTTMGALFLFGGIWGRSTLYASGVSRGDQPALEVMLMIPMPLVGVTLVLWGLGKLFKGMVGAASGEASKRDT